MNNVRKAMPKGRFCPRHGFRRCPCEMGNLYRFTEPVVLLCLARRGAAHGYIIARAADQAALTATGMDSGAVYRTLRRLESKGMVLSRWENEDKGPRRRVYEMTERGREHLREWLDVLEDVRQGLQGLIGRYG